MHIGGGGDGCRRGMMVNELLTLEWQSLGFSRLMPKATPLNAYLTGE